MAGLPAPDLRVAPRRHTSPARHDHRHGPAPRSRNRRERRDCLGGVPVKSGRRPCGRPTSHVRWRREAIGSQNGRTCQIGANPIPPDQAVIVQHAWQLQWRALEALGEVVRDTVVPATWIAVAVMSAIRAVLWIRDRDVSELLTGWTEWRVHRSNSPSEQLPGATTPRRQWGPDEEPALPVADNRLPRRHGGSWDLRAHRNQPFEAARRELMEAGGLAAWLPAVQLGAPRRHQLIIGRFRRVPVTIVSREMGPDGQGDFVVATPKGNQLAGTVRLRRIATDAVPRVELWVHLATSGESTDPVQSRLRRMAGRSVRRWAAGAPPNANRAACVAAAASGRTDIRDA